MRAVLTLVMILTGFASTVHAFDATGHWVGKWSCKGFSAPFAPDDTHPEKLVNKFTSSNSESTLDITQSGSPFGAIIDAGQQGGNFPYNAFAVDAVKDPDNNGNIIFLGCHNANTLPATADAEIIQASIKTKAAPEVKATLKGTSIFVDDFPESGICKYSYKRTSLTDNAGATPCSP